MRPSLRDKLATRHAQRDESDALRRLRTIELRDGARVRREGGWLVDFASNDYLGLATHPDVIAALRDAAAEHGVGGTAASLVCGHHGLHRMLEEEAADWLGQPRALLFGSGYLANLGVLQGLLEADDLCVQDKLNHACLIDGARLSGATLKRYPHGNVAAAERQLQSEAARAALIATDGVFSMDGDLAPLAELAPLAARESALLYVDDAHGIGVHGPGGRGTAALLGLTPEQAPLQLLTLGKALGAYGALVIGQDALIEEVLQGARSYLFTTALPPALAAAALAALRIVRDDAEHRARLHTRIAHFRSGAADRELPLLDSSTPIQPLLLGSNARALALSAHLQAAGLLVPAIRPPTVPAGSARLRISLSAAHTETDIERLLDALASGLRTLPVY